MFIVRILVDGQITGVGELKFGLESHAMELFESFESLLTIAEREDMEQEVTVQVSDALGNVITEGTWKGNKRVG